LPETGHIKKPRPDGGVFGIGLAVDYRARRSRVPGRRPFFDDRAAHEFVIMW
jgi:hypothetical protein